MRVCVCVCVCVCAHARVCLCVSVCACVLDFPYVLQQPQFLTINALCLEVSNYLEDDLPHIQALQVPCPTDI